MESSQDLQQLSGSTFTESFARSSDVPPPLLSDFSLDMLMSELPTDFSASQQVNGVTPSQTLSQSSQPMLFDDFGAFGGDLDSAFFM